MLEQLRLHRQASPQLAPIHPIAHVAQHDVVGARHFVHAELVQHAAGAGLRDPVGERARVHPGAGDDARVRGVLLEQLFAAVLHVEVLGFGDGEVVGEDDAG